MADPAVPLEPMEARKPSQLAATKTPSPADERVRSAVQALERELASQRRRRWVKWAVFALLVVAVLVGVQIFRSFGQAAPAPRFTTEKVEVRDVLAQVLSTGSVKPVTEVQVGAQVSGRIVKVFVDFNSVVKKGEPLAELDPSLFGAQVHQVGAQLSAAKAHLAASDASLRTATLNLERLKRLRRENLSTDTDIDRAEGEYRVAEAELAAAKAQIEQLQGQLSSARTTLGYTRIFSPIDGVVISRSVDVGQTVAASFSAPVLFVIAQDLSKMQVLADIDEADVGQLKEQMQAEVVVDAFPGDTFAGSVTQIRYSPNTSQGVVTYSAVVEVANPDYKLRPGMTATVTLRTREARAVPAVRNSALRFQPLPEMDAAGKPLPAPAREPLKPGQGRVYVAVTAEGGEQRAEARVVAIGITDGIWTELVNAVLPVGTALITEESQRREKRGFRLF